MCYRTNFEDGKGLSSFTGWMREEPQNRQMWERTLLAHLSLVWEGEPRITRELIRARMKLMMWIWQIVEADPVPDVGVSLSSSFFRK